MNADKQFEGYGNWLVVFSKSDLGDSALERLKKKFSKGGHSENFGRLQTQILYNCFLADIYKKETDPNNSLRKLYEGSFPIDLESTISNVDKIRNFIKHYPDASSWAMLQAYNKLKDNNFKFYSVNVDKKNLHEFLDILLEGLSEGLRKPIPGVKSGPWLHRWAIGALLYPENSPLDQQPQRPKDIAVSSLAFILVSIFREHTNNWEGSWRDCGRPMPKYGAPNNSLVADFINSTFNLTKTEDDIKQTVRILEKKNAMINKWPHEKVCFD